MLTTYGTRLLEPFSHRWFYGDALFIIDPWIWLMLILGLEMSWRAERLGRNWTPAGAVGVRGGARLYRPQRRRSPRAPSPSRARWSSASPRRA